MMNPFQPTKSEFEKKPRVWLSSWAKGLIRNKKADFVVGTRGSGKTTVLRSLHSKLLFENELLAEQFPARRFHWFGCYMQFNHSFQHLTEDIQKQVSSGANREPTDLERYKLFCAFFELSLLESVLEDLKSLEDNETLHFSAKKEFEACQEISEVFANLGLKHVRKIADYSDALRLVRTLRSSFLAIYDNEKLSEARMVIDAFTPATLIKLISNKIVPSVMHSRLKKSSELDLFILLDDCENLSSLQQKALNTYLRSTEGQAKWVVAYIRGEYNTVETTIPETSLSHADRKFCNVDELKEDDFKKFCESVADLRIRGLVTTNTKKVTSDNQLFSLDKKCGDPSYNSLMEEVLGGQYRSAAVTKFRSDVGRTKELLDRTLSPDQKSSFHVVSGRSPFTEHVVIDSLGLDVTKYPTKDDQVRLRKEIYRKEAIAYIVACLQCNRPPIYAGQRFIIWASDGNIRDFLDIMAEFFDAQNPTSRVESESGQTLARACRKFLNNSQRFSFKLQDQALKAVSGHSFETIEEMQDTGDAHQYYLLSGVAELLKLLHQYNENGEAVRYPDRGVFVVNAAQFAALARTLPFFDITSLLRRIERDGFVRILDGHSSIGKDDIAFRLHRRLSAHLQCSPRGAYENTRIDPKALVRLMAQVAPLSPSDWAKEYFDGFIAVDKRQGRFEI
ncbi:hypothetical protein [uncultured Roseobacter sp.]|uniref:ORC-CDC6 family AAA ATPase n=1 Tax=uncultured Roseobacter sp. TaxID=114847 RepID=UPI0026287101|nr:hypothetical protein [uncultured Roseobacter sp.]